MKTILVAGAGHGGLSAAIHLAKAGFDVTVVEKQARDALGYDWDDAIRRNTFQHADLPNPPEDLFIHGERMSYRGPSKRKVVIAPNPPSSNCVFIDRKGLLKYLLDLAEESGVRLRFERKILGAVVEGDRVTGLRVACPAGETFMPADLVIDAAGMHSPVRASLPAEAGIPARVPPESTFYAWRGYFAVSETLMKDPAYNVYFYHCGAPGMDWMLTRGTHADVLIGSFHPMQQADIEARVADFRREYPQMTDKLIAGGRYETIPLGAWTPVFVWNGYAAVGNSACMTEPLSGSGMDLSIRIGKALADVVIEAKDFTIDALWPYNYKAIHSFAHRYYSDMLIKRLLSALTGEEIDFLLEKNVLTEKELCDGGKKYTLMQLLKKGNMIRRPRLVASLTQMLQKTKQLTQLREALPQTYDPEGVQKWKALYASILG